MDAICIGIYDCICICDGPIIHLLSRLKTPVMDRWTGDVPAIAAQRVPDGWVVKMKRLKLLIAHCNGNVE